MQTKVLYLFTRTPLHIGAGNSAGYVDSPVQREKHTSFVFIPASSFKGSCVDLWDTAPDGQRPENSDTEILFGANGKTKQQAGQLIFTEGRLLAFPVRSATGCFAWITSPLLLRRAVQDGALPAAAIPKFNLAPINGQQSAMATSKSAVVHNNRLVLENEPFVLAPPLAPTSPPTASMADLATALQKCFPADAIWSEILHHLAVVSDEMLSHFVETSCELSPHVAISDHTGTAIKGGLFNQENVPAETLFYLTIAERRTATQPLDVKSPITKFVEKIVGAGGFIQIGADATTGLGQCSLSFQESA